MIWNHHLRRKAKTETKCIQLCAWNAYFVTLTAPGWVDEALQDTVHSGALERYLATSFKMFF